MPIFHPVKKYPKQGASLVGSETQNKLLSMIDRRTFLQKSTLASAGMGLLPTLATLPAYARPTAATEKMIGIQMGGYSFYDEGMEKVLDFLRDEAAINTLMIYSHTYYSADNRPAHVLANDHGIDPALLTNRKLTKTWVRHDERYYKNTTLRHFSPDSSYLYAEKDIFREILPLARQRNMKVLIRLMELSADKGMQYIHNFESVLTRDIDGKPSSGPCWNNPDYRNWVYATVEDLFNNYDIDGMQYGAERTGALSRLLFQGSVPDCFCEHCRKRNEGKGIDFFRAKEGFTRLYRFIKAVEAGTHAAADTVMVNVLRYLQEYPEILAWNFQWFRADEEIQQEVYTRIKKIKPDAIVGRHVDHQRSTWDIFYRSAITYGEMATHADFIKPILYHDILGPRLRWWVLERMKDRVLKDLSLEQSLDLFYAWMGFGKEAQVALNELEPKGMGPEYVYNETRRCVASVDGKSKVIAGIGIDVPWHAPEGLVAYPSDAKRLQESVFRAMDAGADGLLASREYDEIRHSSLRAFGEAVRKVQ
jgi:hypothetical protein